MVFSIMVKLLYLVEAKMKYLLVLIFAILQWQITNFLALRLLHS